MLSAGVIEGEILENVCSSDQMGNRPRSTIPRAQIPYLTLSALLFGAMLVQTLGRRWTSDVWLHMAAIEAVRGDPISPGNELLAMPGPSSGITPYTMTLGIAARLSGASTATILQIAGLLNLVLFLVAFRAVACRLLRDDLAVFAALLATLVIVGPQAWRWSGFLHLNAIGFALPYPSFFATAAGLGAVWLFLSHLENRSPNRLVALAVLVPVVVLSHPFTGGWISLTLLCFAPAIRTSTRKKNAAVLGAAAVAAALMLLWPHFSIIELFRSGDGAYAELHETFYRTPVRYLIVLAPAIWVAGHRFATERTDPLVLMFASSAAVYALGYALDLTTTGRVLPMLFLSAHLLIGQLAAAVLRSPARHPMAAVALVATFGIGVRTIAPGLPRMLPSPMSIRLVGDRHQLEPITGDYGAILDSLPKGSIIAASSLELSRVAPAHGYGVVGPGYPSAFIPDLGVRWQEQSRLLDPMLDPSEREELIEKYEVDALLCHSGRCDDLVPGSRTIRQGEGWALTELPRPVGN